MLGRHNTGFRIVSVLHLVKGKIRKCLRTVPGKVGFVMPAVDSP